MNYIEKLIKEKCPQSIEWKKLGDFCDIKTGKGITNKDVVEDGIYPIISGGVQPMGNYNNYNRGAMTVTIARAGTAGYINFIDKPFYLNDKCFSVVPRNGMNSKFLYYCLKNKEKEIIDMKSTGSVPTINTLKVSSIIVPVPPLEVQEEIVKVLDNFAELTEELKTKLTEELTARKTQYEYYRSKLLKPEKIEFNELTLGNILKIKNGKDYKHLNSGDIPVYGSGGIMTYVDEYCFDKPSVLIPRKGSVDKLYYVDKPFWNVDTIFYTDINTELAIPKFIFYYLQNEHLEKLNIAGGVPSLTQEVLKRVKVKLPSIYIQEKIVNVLDNFEAICSDLNIGLPAEINERQKQYEYYRDRLLTFNFEIPTLETDRQAGLIRLLQYVYGVVYLPLSYCANLIAGGDVPKQNLSREKTEYFKYKVISNGCGDNAVYGYTNIAKINKPSVTISARGTIGYCSLQTEPFYPIVRLIVCTPYDGLNVEYLKYYLETVNFQCTKSGIPQLTIPMIKNVMIPVVDLKKQEHIVNYLNKFNCLLTDYYSGLPAEIEARQKQYEYYRNKLLSFE